MDTMLLVGNGTSFFLTRMASIPTYFLLPRDDALNPGPLHRPLPLLSLSRSRCSLPLPLPSAVNGRRGKSAPVADSDMEEEEEEEEEFEEGEFVAPFANAREWLQKKPLGFGEDKVYDTSIEDKLAEEIERSRRVQAANIAYLKAHPTSYGSKKDPNMPKDIEPPSSFRVRVFNLPKKKNIGRDLKAAFQQVPGLLSIVPAVSGSKKTKDPICKGFAFVYFKSKEDAARFARQFSGQAIGFGRIQKPIKCQMMNPQLANSTSDDKLTVREGVGFAEELDADFASSDLSFEVTTFVEFDEEDEADEFDEEDDMFDDEFIDAEFKDVTDDIRSRSVSPLNGNAASTQRGTQAASGSHSLKNQRDKSRVSKKKPTPKGKNQKLPKLDIPGSAKRLKVKDKAMLSGVFAKYASQDALAAEPEPQR